MRARKVDFSSFSCDGSTGGAVAQRNGTDKINLGATLALAALGAARNKSRPTDSESKTVSRFGRKTQDLRDWTRRTLAVHGEVETGDKY